MASQFGHSAWTHFPKSAGLGFGYEWPLATAGHIPLWIVKCCVFCAISNMFVLRCRCLVSIMIMFRGTVINWVCPVQFNEAHKKGYEVTLGWVEKAINALCSLHCELHDGNMGNKVPLNAEFDWAMVTVLHRKTIVIVCILPYDPGLALPWRWSVIVWKVSARIQHLFLIQSLGKLCCSMYSWRGPHALVQYAACHNSSVCGKKKWKAKICEIRQSIFIWQVQILFLLIFNRVASTGNIKKHYLQVIILW